MNPIRDRIPTISSLPFGDDTDDVDDPEPEDWDRKGRLAKLWTALSVCRFLTASVLFLVVTLILYLYPVVPTARRSVGMVSIAVLTVVFSAWGLYNRILAIRGLQRYDLHINYEGSSVSARLGRETDVDDEEIRGYKILRKFSLGGLVTAYEGFRDRHSRREISEHKEKYHRVADDGSGEVIDGALEAQTAEADALRNDIELFNSTVVTYTGRQKPNVDGKEIDSVSTIPPTIGFRTSAQVHRGLREASRRRKGRSSGSGTDSIRYHRITWRQGLSIRSILEI